MGKQITEMLKGTLEGIVLAILSVRPAYGYEITAWLRDQGFSDIVEGTVHALLIRISKSASSTWRRSRPRRGRRAGVLAQRAGAGTARKSSGGRGASSLSSIEKLHEGESDHGRKVDRDPHRFARAEEAVQAVQGRIEALPEPYGTVAKALSGASCTTGASRTVRPHSRCSATSPTSGSALPPMGRRCARSSATTRWSSPRPSPRPTPASSGSTRNAPTPPAAIEDAERGEQK